jgi:hypothetical protein
VIEILQALTVILDFDHSCGLKGEQSFAYQFEVETGLDQLEALQKHPNITVFNAVDAMISKYFDEDEDQQP